VNSASIVAWMPPYSVVFSLTAPERQMVVVPAISTSATTAMAKVSFTALPRMLLPSDIGHGGPDCRLLSGTTVGTADVLVQG